MMNNLIALTQELGHYALLLAVQLVLILVVRKPLLRVCGAVWTYRLWLLPVLWAPLYFIDWSLVHPEVAGNGIVDKMLWAPMDLLSAPQEVFPESVPGSLPTQSEPIGMAPAAWAVDWRSVLAWLWLAGVLILLIRQAVAIRLFKAYLKQHGVSVSKWERRSITENSTISPRVPVFVLAGLDTPALFGVVRPALLLPKDFLDSYDIEQRRLILFHEAVHLQRRDNLWNLFAWGLKSLFWFNPLVHLAYRCYRADQELSCDALALGHSTAVQRRRYAKSLLQSFSRAGSCRKSPLLTAWGSLNAIEERIAMIKQYPRRKPRPLLFRASLFSVLLSGAGITALVSASLSPVALAAEATGLDSIPVDRSALSSTFADAADQAVNLLRGREYDSAESILDALRGMQQLGDLNADESLLLWDLAGDLALARGNMEAALEAYAAIQNVPAITAAQREAAMLQLGDAYIATGLYASNYKRGLALYRELAEMSGGRNPVYLFRIAEALHRLKQRESALAAVQEAIETYGDDAPRSAYRLLWQLTPSMESKRRIHETMVEKFDNPQDAARLAAFIREDGSYDPRLLGPSIGMDSAVVTPDGIRFAPSARPLEFVQPVYPEEALLKGIEGWTVMVFNLDSDGGVADPVILGSNHEGTFDASTLAAMSQFRFDPRQIESDSEEFDMAYVMRFEIPEQD